VHPLVNTHREQLEELCKRFHIKRLYLFGSAATGAFKSETSDLDFLVEFERVDQMNTADQYFGLLEGLKATFKQDVDLVSVRAMRNPYFIQEVNKTRMLLYAA
jgi:hypothetical protein